MTRFLHPKEPQPDLSGSGELSPDRRGTLPATEERLQGQASNRGAAGREPALSAAPDRAAAPAHQED